MKRHIFFTAIALSIIFSGESVFSESNISETGKTGLSFLNIAPSSRIGSLGGVGCAFSNGASSIWSNPALIASQEEKSAQFSHTEWIEGIKQEYAAFSSRIDYGSIGIAVQLFDSGDIDGRDDYGGSTGSYSIKNTALSISYASTLFDMIDWGLAYKKLYQKVSDETAGGYAIDGGVTVHTPLNGLYLAAVARNYGHMSKLRNERTKLPSNVCVGGLYSGIAPGIDRSFSALADIVFPRYGNTGIRLGLEVEAVDYFSLRIGYRNDSDFEDFSFGAGFAWEMVSIDIAYTPMNNISDDAIRFTLCLTGF